MRTHLACWITAAGVAGCAAPEAPSGNADAALRAATQQWVAAFNACKDADAMASLYEPGAQLWGTVSATLSATPEAIRQYFAACAATPKPTVELGAFAVRSYGDMGVSAGSYTFTIFPGGQQRIAPARFTLTFKRSGDRWLIVSHHSSLLPAPPAAPVPPAPPVPPRQ